MVDSQMCWTESYEFARLDYVNPLVVSYSIMMMERADDSAAVRAVVLTECSVRKRACNRLDL